MDGRKDFYFDFKFFKALLRLTPKFFTKKDIWVPIMFILTTGISVGSEFLTYRTGKIPGKMYGFLMEKKSPEFWEIFWQGTLMYLANTFVITLISTSSWFLYLALRRNITNAIHQVYFKGTTAYKIINNSYGSVDNPDQRITQDIEKMCNMLATKILPSVLICPFVVAWYTRETLQTSGIYGVLTIYAYFLIGTLINKILISPLSKWSARIERCEGNYRYKHVTIRDNIEQISMYQGQEFEKVEATSSFDFLIKNQFFLMIWRTPAMFFQTFFDYYGGMLSYALNFAPVFIFGTYDKMDAGDFATALSNNSFVYIYLINSFTRLTDTAFSAGEMAGVLQRVGQLFDICERMEGSDYAKHGKSEEDMINLENITISTPNTHSIIKRLSLIVKSGERLIIQGCSGVGKSSLIRVISGVWKQDSGTISSTLSKSQISILPQKPYFPVGGLTLYQQLTFPKLSSNDYLMEDQLEKNITSLMFKLDLGNLVDLMGGLHSYPRFEFSDVLTPGEMQRLSFIRAILSSPKLLILDEATNSVSPEMEELMYNMLIEKNIEFISIGHAVSLSKFHSKQLTLFGNGEYKVKEL
uniref:ABC transporter domain-containing protein n=1 Tax=Rhabditophanes sp. KR3021 TaxID=114890 RepID=A0AC35UEK5_9BILA